MAELLDESSNLESTTVGVFRTAATIKGGRRFSFSALVVVGDRRGQVGFGYAKAKEVPPAIEKAQKEARKQMHRITLHGRTLPHTVTGRYGASEVRLIPAAPGTGVVAGAAVRAILEMAGVTDCLSKCYGSTNKQNVVKAAMDGLKHLTTREKTATLRGVTIDKTDVDDMIARSGISVTASVAPSGDRARGPRNTVGDNKGGRGGGRGGRGGGGGGRGGPGGGRGGRGGGGGGGGDSGPAAPTEGAPATGA